MNPNQKSKRDRVVKSALALILALALIPAFATTIAAAQSAPDFPGKDWQLVKPESEGYSPAKLEALRAWLAAGPTTGMTILVHGHMIFSYGDTAKVSKVASVRKSILSILYGKYVANNTIDLNKTVEQLGLSEPDRQFLPSEKNATLEQLLAGRSGIYLLPEGVLPTKDLIQAAQPQRGSELPGMYFHYNDWDFNAAGTAFEKLTGKNIYDALETDLALPLQMQDFDRSAQKKITHDGQVHPEYAMYLSTRDMARIGLLMLRGGNWAGKQLVPIEWVGRSASNTTPFIEMNPPYLRSEGAPERWGFGLMWWAWDAGPFIGGIYITPFQGAYEARGTAGQYITILPAKDMVLVHKVFIDVYPQPAINQEEWDTITNMAISAACSGPCK
ncbi:MAG: serine hydrolase [Terracidiphilus sp.]|jgi:CubicO group peptidase (beta-lactamase class C family)